MSQRSQFNERYAEDNKPKGVTRKGAGTVKPKSTAASSVYIQPEKTKEQKKAARKQREKVEREKQERLDRKLSEKRGGNKLTSPLIKKYRQWWWVCLVAAILLTILSWFGRDYMPEAASFVTLILAYAAIVAALYLDLGKIRKERNRLQEQALSMNTKASKAERRAMRAEERAARKEVEAEMKAEKEQSGKQEGGLFSRSKKAATEAADTVVEKQQAAKAGK